MQSFKRKSFVIQLIFLQIQLFTEKQGIAHVKLLIYSICNAYLFVCIPHL